MNWKKKMEITGTFKTARRNDSRNISTWISFLCHFVVDFQLNKKNAENHGNTWRVLTFVHSNYPSTGIYILNLCHKNKLNWGGEENEVARIWINEWLIEINRLLKKWLKLFAADVIFKSL